MINPNSIHRGLLRKYLTIETASPHSTTHHPWKLMKKNTGMKVDFTSIIVKNLRVKSGVFDPQKRACSSDRPLPTKVHPPVSKQMVSIWQRLATLNHLTFKTLLPLTLRNKFYYCQSQGDYQVIIHLIHSLLLQDLLHSRFPNSLYHNSSYDHDK